MVVMLAEMLAAPEDRLSTQAERTSTPAERLATPAERTSTRAERTRKLERGMSMPVRAAPPPAEIEREVPSETPETPESRRGGERIAAGNISETDQVEEGKNFG